KIFLESTEFTDFSRNIDLQGKVWYHVSMNNSQLISFKLKNYRSYYTEQTAVFGKEDARTITAIYGPNASGKTNISKALGLAFFFIRNSNNAELKKIPYNPFLLKETSSNEPSEF